MNDPSAPSLHTRSLQVLGGRFAIEREVGRGAAGIVYRAVDRATGDTVALKVLAVRGVDTGEEARFTREGRVLASLDHPGIVKLVAFGTLDDGLPYLAMEWLEGEDVAARMRRAPLSGRDALEVARQAAEALAAAHAAGVIHRDVKPTNLFVMTNAEGGVAAKLVDFGVASGGDAKLTQHGTIVGTPAYMAPEQARGDGPVDARADLYSLGATLFEMLAGRPPHVGATPLATLARVVTTPAPRLLDFAPEAPASLDDLVARLLATRPEDRPDNAAAVATELALILADATIGSMPPPTSAELPTSISSGAVSRLVTSIVALCGRDSGLRERAIGALREHGAEAVPFGLDGLVAHLGVRRSLGDEAARALEVSREIAKLGAKVGVATGRARVHLTRPVGDVVDRAAAFARDAPPGQVVADATTTELVRGLYELQQRGDGAALVGERVVRRRETTTGGAPFVGREAELAQIVAAYERCVDDESPVVVSCTGPPGIGKSRLSHEALARLMASTTPPRLVVVRSASFGRSHSLGAAAAALRALLAGQPPASAAGATLVSAVPGVHDPLVRLLANQPLDDAPGARDALWLAMTDVLVGAAKATPIAVVLEDAQWADAESISFFDHALGRAGQTPLWLLLLARPAFWAEHPRTFVGRDHVRLELRPISKRATRAIAHALLGPRANEESLDRIANQAGGSPLFAEELARLMAAGRDPSQAPTIEAAIQASLDSLDDPSRGSIERLSVFGIAGWEPGLVALGVPDASETLRRLSASEFVIERAETRFPGAREWAFKHALVREVAYASLGAEAKRELHGEAARWLESMGDDSAVVARHYELGALTERAAIHWERAARRALATNALADAVTLAERALAYANAAPMAFRRALVLDEAFGRLDARAADRETAVTALADNVYDVASEVRAAGARARYDEARGADSHIAERLADVAARAAALGLADEEARCRAALAARLAFGGQLEAAANEAGRLLSLAEREGIAPASIDAWQTLAIVRQTRGELISALDARRNAARAAATCGIKEREATLTINVGFALTTFGERGEAKRAIEEGIAIANAIGSEGVVRLGKMLLLGWAGAFGPEPEVDALLVGLRAEADAAAGGQWVASDRVTIGVLFYRAVELLRADAPDETQRARVLLKSAAQTYRATGMRDILPVALGFWAEAERRAGNAETAVELATEASALLDAGAPSLLNEAPVYLALHDATIDLGDLRAGRAAIERAMPPLLRRVDGLRGSNYALAFLTLLPHNAGLLAAAEAYGLVPPEIEAVLERGES